jgi:lipopolysaccharide export system protein LptC
VAVELHLPDLPEVPLSLGPPAPMPEHGRHEPRRQPWAWRLRDALSSYLPLLLMTLLALGTWWLVKHTPSAPPLTAPVAVRREPDYTMSQFSIDHFERDGRLRVRVEGAQLRHYPDTDRYEIDDARIRAFAPNGDETLAVARRALANGDISELQLMGDARVTHTVSKGRELEMRSEFLHAFLVTERVQTHLPVHVFDGTDELWGDGLLYDHPNRLLELRGRGRALLAPGAGKADRRNAP